MAYDSKLIPEIHNIFAKSKNNIILQILGVESSLLAVIGVLSVSEVKSGPSNPDIS